MIYASVGYLTRILMKQQKEQDKYKFYINEPQDFISLIVDTFKHRVDFSGIRMSIMIEFLTNECMDWTHSKDFFIVDEILYDSNVDFFLIQCFIDTKIGHRLNIHYNLNFNRIAGEMMYKFMRNIPDCIIEDTLLNCNINEIFELYQMYNDPIDSWKLPIFKDAVNRLIIEINRNGGKYE